MFFRFTVLLFHIPTVCWCHICAKNLCNSKICITDSWLWRDVKLGSVRIVAVSLPVDGGHGTPLWTTTEFTLFLLQYGLAFVSRESGILVETRFRNFGQRQCS